MNRGLYRSRTDKVIAGVAGGVAKSLNLDPVIIRIIFVLLFFFGGGGAILYIILWIALPEESFDFNPDRPPDWAAGEKTQFADEARPEENYLRQRENGSLVIGGMLIILGVILLLVRYFDWHQFRHLWPLVLVAAGVLLLTKSFYKR